MSRLPTSPLRKPPARSGADGRETDAPEAGCAAFRAPACALAGVFDRDLAVVVLALAVDVVFRAVVFRFVVVAGDGMRAALVLRAVVLRAGAAVDGAFIDDMLLAAVVSCSAAVIIALVAVFIAFMAVFIACAELVALVAACVIFVAADDTLVAAEETLPAAAAGVTVLLRAVLAGFLAVVLCMVPVVSLAMPVRFLAPAAFVRLVSAVERRAADLVFVGTDPSPRVDQLWSIHSTIDDDLHARPPFTRNCLQICWRLDGTRRPRSRPCHSPAVGAAARIALGRRAGAPALGLTPRELEVLRLVAQGWGSREIAARLFISA